MKNVISKTITVGVLAIQGDYFAHEAKLKELGINSILVKKPEQLEKCDGLIIPGGESTTILKFFEYHNFIPHLEEFHKSGKAIFGTCAGLILLSKKVYSPNQLSLGFIDIEAERNAYGRQKDSFVTNLVIPELDTKPIELVFIRAPKILSMGKNVKVIAEYEDNKIMVYENNILVSSFHPEMTDDNRIHKYFLEKFFK